MFYPADSDEQCERAGLYVEKAFILIDKHNGKTELAQEALLAHANEIDIQKAITLAIEYDFIDQFIEKLINRANRKTADLNTLLKYIECVAKPERIIS